MFYSKYKQHGFASLVGLVIAALLLLILFIAAMKGNTISDSDKESNMQNPDKYQEEVDAALTQSAERNEELYEFQD